MIENEKEKFVELMKQVSDSYGTDPKLSQIDFYFETLKNKYEFNEIAKALGYHVMNSQFYPKIADIVSAIDGSEDDKIKFAFEDAKLMIRKLGMYRNIKMSNPISQQIIRDFGGLLRWDELTYAYEHGKNDKLYFEWQRMYKNYLDKMKRGEWMPEERPLSGYGSSYDASGKYSIPELWGYTEEQKQIEQKKYLKLEYKKEVLEEVK